MVGGRGRDRTGDPLLTNSESEFAPREEERGRMSTSDSLDGGLPSFSPAGIGLRVACSAAFAAASMAGLRHKPRHKFFG